MQSIIVTSLGILVIFGLPTFIFVKLAGLQKRERYIDFTYGGGLMWLLLVGGLGVVYIGIVPKLDWRAESFADFVGISYIYVFVLYLVFGVIVLGLRILRLLRKSRRKARGVC